MCYLYTVPGPVHSLLVIPLSSTALFIRWSEPDIKNGIILGYSVEIVGSYQNLMDNDTGFVQVNHLSKLFLAILMCLIHCCYYKP